MTQLQSNIKLCVLQHAFPSETYTINTKYACNLVENKGDTYGIELAERVFMQTNALMSIFSFSALYKFRSVGGIHGRVE